MPNITPGFDAAKQEQLRLDRVMKDAGHRFGVQSSALKKVDSKQKLEAELKQFFDSMMNRAMANNDKLAWEQLFNFMRSISEQDETFSKQINEIDNLQSLEQKKQAARNLIRSPHFVSHCAKALYPLYMKNPDMGKIFGDALTMPLKDMMQDYSQLASQAGYNSTETRIAKQIMNWIFSLMFAFANLCSIKMGNGPLPFKVDGSPLDDSENEGPKPENEKVRIIHK